jgi:hypothetical protein
MVCFINLRGFLFLLALGATHDCTSSCTQPCEGSSCECCSCGSGAKCDCQGQYRTDIYKGNTNSIVMNPTEGSTAKSFSSCSIGKICGTIKSLTCLERMSTFLCLQ